MRRVDEKSDELNVEHKYNGFKTTFEGKELDVYLGIPFAEPPIGDLRFRKPKPYKWDGQVIDAKTWPNNCIEVALMPNNSEWFRQNSDVWSEDCLYLNIWSPQRKSSYTQRPVLVWIHGGGLIAGSSTHELTNGEALAALGDVVVVSIQYRLHALGFLYSGTDEAPGNVGLWDQAMALQWIQDNIAHFGGDPNQVTIFGCSAGGWSVSLHVLSPISRGLFRNGIVMSGAGIVHQTGQSPQQSLQNWLKVAKAAKCGDGKQFTDKDMECLRQIPAQELAQSYSQPEMTSDWMGIMAIVTYGDQFLPERPLDMLEKKNFKKDMSLLATTCEDEGGLFLPRHVKIDYFIPHSEIKLSKEEAIEILKNISKQIKSDIPVNVEAGARLYMSSLPSHDSELLLRTIGIAMGDFLLVCPTKQFAKAVFSDGQTNNKVYEYHYTSAAKPTPGKHYCSKWMGACHCMDNIMQFGYPIRHPEGYSDQDIALSRRMIDSLAYFAKHNELPPQEGIEWQSYYTLNGDVVRPHYEWAIAPNAGLFKNALKETECQFWKYYIDRQ
ncbi:unnamed protein product [Medioppia subpectinata]|uniref:Carboxylic ester hydrolase n=1 Tax=Medioppia subpectinata TaxID=1979941 RepID=A0A7R9KQV5_9ACAR|nr:unnamed protein product [Medioppia subpectinata]CAG2108106.1 unnamed protein product [Medioppia subpectinata]